MTIVPRGNRQDGTERKSWWDRRRARSQAKRDRRLARSQAKRDRYDRKGTRGSGTGLWQSIRFVVPFLAAMGGAIFLAVYYNQLDYWPLAAFLFLVCAGYALGAYKIRRAGHPDLDWYRPSILITHHGEPWRLFGGALLYSTIGQALTLFFAKLIDSKTYRAGAEANVAISYVQSPTLIFSYAAFLAGAWSVLNTAVLLQRQRGRFLQISLMQDQMEALVEEVRVRRATLGGRVEHVLLVTYAATFPDLLQANETVPFLTHLREMAALPNVQLHIVVATPRLRGKFMSQQYQDDISLAREALAKADAAHTSLDVNRAAVWYSSRITAEQYLVSQARTIEFSLQPSLYHGTARLTGEATQDESRTDYVNALATSYLRDAITPLWQSDGKFKFTTEQPRILEVQLVFSSSEAALLRLDLEEPHSSDVKVIRNVNVKQILRAGACLELQEIDARAVLANLYCRVRLVKSGRDKYEAPVVSLWSAILTRPPIRVAIPTSTSQTTEASVRIGNTEVTS